jgi:hypothetical protein
MEFKPYRVHRHRRNNPFSGNKNVSQEKTELNALDISNFPSISDNLINNRLSEKWGCKKKEKQDIDFAPKGIPSVCINKGWLYMDLFDKVNGKPLIVYGGETKRLSKIKESIYWSNYKADFKRYLSYARHDAEINEAIGDSRSLILEISERERKDWLDNDVPEEQEESSEEEDELQTDDDYLE